MGSPDARRQWWVLVGTCLGLFILMLDSTVVALALPTIETELHATADNVQWVLNGYLLVLSVLVVTAGRLGGIFGGRLFFLIGTGVFAAGPPLAGHREPRVPGRAAGPGPRHLGGGLGSRAGDRPARRGPADRRRLAADLL